MGSKSFNRYQSTKFLGFLRPCYLADFASTAEPPWKMTRKNELFGRKPEQHETFERIWNQMASAPLMAIFSVNSSTFVYTDASDCGMGAVLSQIQDDPKQSLRMRPENCPSQKEDTLLAKKKPWCASERVRSGTCTFHIEHRSLRPRNST